MDSELDEVMDVMDTGHTYVAYGASGSGTYGCHYTGFTDTLLAPMKRFILDLVRCVPFPCKSKVYNIGDYGTADGAASMAFMKELILCLRDQHGPEVEFQVIYEDIEVNDFNSLFKRLSGLIPDPPSYLLDLDKVYALASGTTFYKQCVPSDSMHIIFCLTAAHWLSRRPTIYRNSINGFRDSSEGEKELLRIQATKDWETFLIRRSRELKSGGLLVVLISSKYTGSRSSSEKISLETFTTILNSQWKRFRDSGMITNQEFVNTNFGYYLFSLQELKIPFLKPSSPASKAGLKILASDTLFYSSGAYDTWKRKNDLTGMDDREEFAKNYVSAHRCWGNSTFMSGLADTRTVVEKEAIVDELYRQVESEVRGLAPEVFRDDLIMSSIIIQKL